MSQAPPDPEYVLRGVAGAVFGRSYHLLSPTTLGRSPECDICLAEAGVSRLHARLRPLDYGVEIEDTESTNGSFLNGQRITLAIARVGDEIAFDQLRFRVCEPLKPSVPAGAARTGTPTGTLRRWAWVLVALAIAGALGAVAMRGLALSGAI